MTDAEKKHLYDVADLFLYFAEKAKREGLLALDDRIDADTMRIHEFDGDERIEFPELSDDEHFAFSLLLGGIVNGTDSKIIAGIAENLLESTGNTTALRLGMEAIRDIQSGVPPAAMELKIYAMLGREIALEYKQHRQDFEDAREEEIAEYFKRTGTENPSDSGSGNEEGSLTFEDIADFDDESVLKILRETEIHEAATALKTGSEKIFCKIRGCLPPKIARALTDEMEFMGPVRVSDVEAAQAHFVRIAERLGGR